MSDIEFIYAKKKIIAIRLKPGVKILLVDCTKNNTCFLLLEWLQSLFSMQ